MINNIQYDNNNENENTQNATVKAMYNDHDEENIHNEKNLKPNTQWFTAIDLYNISYKYRRVEYGE